MYIKSFTLWAPGIETEKDWNEWLNGKKTIEDSPKAPVISFASPITTRRLSQLTKMVCYAAERLGMDADELFVTSVYGETNAQFKINKTHVLENEVKPASFSLSVFNASAAEATILLDSQIPYSVFFSGKDKVISNLLKVGTAPISSCRINSSILIYAEESLPPGYRGNAAWIPDPIVIGIKITSEEGEVPNDISDHEELIRYLLTNCSEAWC